ncbi:SMI1/KNR4 family protein [Cryptosporangium minutisporangium]|uniref:Knr4/Smi1-like domain-containing protein n=1 Tax=Cryptosporangium minutisporangium TaxID=113569 RepID=A0ABP6SPR2_9ACTN
MIEVQLHTPDDWRQFLRDWSAEWISAAAEEPDRQRIPAEVVESGWLGYDPATEEVIGAAEQRLGTRLPPSYRQFLAISDGWRNTSPFIDDLLPVGEVGWFRDLNTDWLRAWAEGAGTDQEDLAVLLGDLPADEDEGEPDVMFEVVLMARALQISGRGDSAVLLLDPDGAGPDGEWRGYFFANWQGALGGGSPSFAALMRSEHQTFVRLNQPAGPTLQAVVEQTGRARRLLLDGRLDEGLPLLVQAREYGLPLAELLDAQAQFLLGDSSQAQSNLRMVFPHHHPELATDRFIASEIVPLLLGGHNEYHVTNYRTQRTDALATLLNDRVADPDAPITFADPQFDAAARHARELVAAGRLDDAWNAIVAALPAWRATSQYALLPAGLIADPILGALLDGPDRKERGEALLRTPRDR